MLLWDKTGENSIPLMLTTQTVGSDHAQLSRW